MITELTFYIYKYIFANYPHILKNEYVVDFKSVRHVFCAINGKKKCFIYFMGLYLSVTRSLKRGLHDQFLEDARPLMLPQFENHVSCLLRFWKK